MHRLCSHPSLHRKPQRADIALRDAAAAMYYSPFLNMDSPFHSIYTVSWSLESDGANKGTKQSTCMCVMLCFAQVEHFVLNEMYVCYFGSSTGAFLFVPFFSVGGAGERSLSGGSPPLPLPLFISSSSACIL